MTPINFWIVAMENHKRLQILLDIQDLTNVLWLAQYTRTLKTYKHANTKVIHKSSVENARALDTSFVLLSGKRVTYVIASSRKHDYDFDSNQCIDDRFGKSGDG